MIEKEYEMLTYGQWQRCGASGEIAIAKLTGIYPCSATNVSYRTQVAQILE